MSLMAICAKERLKATLAVHSCDSSEQGRDSVLAFDRIITEWRAYTGNWEAKSCFSRNQILFSCLRRS